MSFEELLMQLLGGGGQATPTAAAAPPGAGVSMGPMPNMDPEVLRMLEMMLSGSQSPNPTGEPYPRTMDPSILERAERMAGAPQTRASVPIQARNY